MQISLLMAKDVDVVSAVRELVLHACLLACLLVIYGYLLQHCELVDSLWLVLRHVSVGRSSIGRSPAARDQCRASCDLHPSA